MADDDRRGVFVSYARVDGQKTARKLVGDLEDQGLEVWMDRLEMRGGQDWWQQIVDAIDRAGFLVLIMTPGAMASRVTEREWRYAREQGKCVFPVLASTVLDFDAMPAWMAAKHFYNLDEEWPTFLNYLRSPCQSNRVPFMAPALPDGYVHREVEVAALRARLLGDDLDGIGSRTSLQGAGGYGKTTLAAAICYDDDVFATFDDGVLWVTLGRDPSIRQELDKLYRALTGQRSPAVDEEEAARDVTELLRNKRSLLVIDDVWRPDDLKWFMQGGEDCARIVTTRQFDVADAAGGEDGRLRIDGMRPDEAVRMIGADLHTSPRHEGTFRRLVDQLGEWPLLVKLAHGAIKAKVRRGATIDRAADHVSTALERHGLTAFDRTEQLDRNAAAAASVAVSVELLSHDDAVRWAQLAVLPGDVAVPLRTAGHIWALDEFDAEAVMQRLDDLSLAMLDLSTQTFSVHDVLLKVAAARVPDGSTLRNNSIDGSVHRLARSMSSDLIAAADDSKYSDWLRFSATRAPDYLARSGTFFDDFDDSDRREIVRQIVRLSEHYSFRAIGTLPTWWTPFVSAAVSSGQLDAVETLVAELRATAREYYDRAGHLSGYETVTDRRAAEIGLFATAHAAAVVDELLREVGYTMRFKRVVDTLSDLQSIASGFNIVMFAGPGFCEDMGDWLSEVIAGLEAGEPAR